MTCIKHCACPNCMAGYESEAYKMEMQRRQRYAEYAIIYEDAPEYHDPLDDGFGNWIAGIIVLAFCIFVVTEFVI